MSSNLKRSSTGASGARSAKKTRIDEQSTTQQPDDNGDSADTLSDSSMAPGTEDTSPSKQVEQTVRNEGQYAPSSATSSSNQHPQSAVAVNKKEMIHLGPDMIKRIISIANYTNLSSRTYAFDLLPDDATWGKRPKFSTSSSASKTVCLKGTLDACTVWFIGRVSKLWFFNSDNEPQSPVKITIDPWSTGTALKLRKKLKYLSQPPQETVTEDLTLIRASRMMAVKGGPADYFTECYDARTVLKPKNQMEAFEIGELGIRDTVVIECNISRVWNKADGMAGKAGKAAASWYGFLQLKAVYLIHKDASAAQEDVDVHEAPQDEDLSL